MTDKDRTAVVHWSGEDLFVGITPTNHKITIDTDHLRHSASSPMELLLLALGSCTGVDVVSILRKKRQDVTDYRVEVFGQRKKEHPRSYEHLKVHHVVTGHSISAKSVADAIELSQSKYCSVAASLRPAAEIVSTFEIIEA